MAVAADVAAAAIAAAATAASDEMPAAVTIKTASAADKLAGWAPVSAAPADTTTAVCATRAAVVAPGDDMTDIHAIKAAAAVAASAEKTAEPAPIPAPNPAPKPPPVVVETPAGVAVDTFDFLTRNHTVRTVQSAVMARRLEKFLASQGVKVSPDFVEFATSNSFHAMCDNNKMLADWIAAGNEAPIDLDNNGYDSVIVCTMTSEPGSLQRWHHDEHLSVLGHGDTASKPTTLVVVFRQDQLDRETAYHRHVCNVAPGPHTGCSMFYPHPECMDPQTERLAKGYSDRCAAMAMLRYEGTDIMSPRYTDDWLFAMNFVVRYGASGFLQVSPRLRDNRYIVLRAVGAWRRTLRGIARRNNMFGAFKYASLRLRSCRDTVMIAVKWEPLSFMFACEALRADRDVVVAAVKCDPTMLAFASEAMRADRDVAAVACDNHPPAVALVSDELRKEFEQLGRIRSVADIAACAAAAAGP